MKNVKRILTLLVVLAMVFGCLFAIAACKPDEEDPNKKPPVGGDTTDIPTADGKVTLYLTAEFGETPAEYVSIFYCGGANGWIDGASKPGDVMGVSAMTRLGTTNTYYIQVALDTTASQYNEYKVGFGYNDKSPLPKDKWGMQNYGYCSDECPTDMTNVTFEWDGSGTQPAGTVTVGGATVFVLNVEECRHL